MRFYSPDSPIGGLSLLEEPRTSPRAKTAPDAVEWKRLRGALASKTLQAMTTEQRARIRIHITDDDMPEVLRILTNNPAVLRGYILRASEPIRERINEVLRAKHGQPETRHVLGAAPTSTLHRSGLDPSDDDKRWNLEQRAAPGDRPSQAWMENAEKLLGEGKRIRVRIASLNGWLPSDFDAMERLLAGKHGKRLLLDIPAQLQGRWDEEMGFSAEKRLRGGRSPLITPGATNPSSDSSRKQEEPQRKSWLRRLFSRG